MRSFLIIMTIISVARSLMEKKIFETDGNLSPLIILNKTRPDENRIWARGTANEKIFLKSKLLESLNRFDGGKERLELIENSVTRDRREENDGEGMENEPIRHELSSISINVSPSPIREERSDFEMNELPLDAEEEKPISSESIIPSSQKILEREKKNMEMSVSPSTDQRISQKTAKTIRKWRKRLYKAYKEGRIFGEVKRSPNGFIKSGSENRLEPSWNSIFFQQKPSYGKEQNGKIVRLTGYEPKAEAVSTSFRRPVEMKSKRQKVVYIPAPNLDKNPQYLFPTTQSPIINQSQIQRLYFVTANPLETSTMELLREFASGFGNLQAQQEKFNAEKGEISPYPPRSFQPFFQNKVDELERGNPFPSAQAISPFGQKSVIPSTAPQFLPPIATLPPANSFLIQKSKGSGGFGIPGEREFVEPDDEDLDDPNKFDFAPIREVRTSSGLMETDDKCNSLRLRTIIQNNIIANDAEASKRAIQQEAERDTGRFVDVICGTGFFSYIAHTDEFCLASAGGVNCYAFSPVCGDFDGPQMEFRKNRQKFVNKN